MSAADYHFHQFRASAQNSPATSRPSSRPASRKSSTVVQKDDAKTIIKSLSSYEWRASGLGASLYSSKPNSRAGSRKNSFSEKSARLSKPTSPTQKENFPPSDIIANNGEVINSDALQKALNTFEWKSSGVYSNPSSAANSRRNSLVGKSPADKVSRQTSINQHKSNGFDGSKSHACDENEMEKALKTCEWKASGIYSSNPNSAANSRRNSLTEKLKILAENERNADLPQEKLARGTCNPKVTTVDHTEQISKDAIQKALNSCEWRAPGIYSSKPNSPSNSRRSSLTTKSTSRKNSVGKDGTKSPRGENDKNLVGKPSQDPLTVVWRASSRPTSRRGSRDEGSQVPSFPLMKILNLI